MFNIIILFILLIGIYSGARRGLIIQSIHTIGYILTLIVANLFNKTVAHFFEMIIPYPSDVSATEFKLYNLLDTLEFDKFFYNILAYISLIFIGWLITRIIANSLNKLAKFPIINQLNFAGGAILGFICNWVGLFFLLTLLSLLPITNIQDIFTPNSLATFIVKQTPIFSQMIINYFINI